MIIYMIENYFSSGLHSKGKVCNPDQRVSSIKNLLTSNKQYLFPKSLAIGGALNAPKRL